LLVNYVPGKLPFGQLHQANGKGGVNSFFKYQRIFDCGDDLQAIAAVRLQVLPDWE